MKSKSASRYENRTPMTARIGAAAWIAATAQLFVGQLAVESAWRTPYSWAGNNISDLGNVHCQMWDASRPSVCVLTPA
ncbi:hypothetical protein AB0P36_22195 [Streptomyces flavidovirens]|uniref:hypothetical protein n=1 Tax=Streptomyces flavidovirens TaxID=67298 RepID=UPI00344162EB